MRTRRNFDCGGGTRRAIFSARLIKMHLAAHAAHNNVLSPINVQHQTDGVIYSSQNHSSKHVNSLIKIISIEKYVLNHLIFSFFDNN